MTNCNYNQLSEIYIVTVLDCKHKFLNTSYASISCIVIRFRVPPVLNDMTRSYLQVRHLYTENYARINSNKTKCILSSHMVWRPEFLCPLFLQKLTSRSRRRGSALKVKCCKNGRLEAATPTRNFPVASSSLSSCWLSVSDMAGKNKPSKLVLSWQFEKANNWSLLESVCLSCGLL